MTRVAAGFDADWPLHWGIACPIVVINGEDTEGVLLKIGFAGKCRLPHRVR